MRILKQILLKLYEFSYRVEKFSLSKKIFTESELYDIRYKIQSETR